MSRKEVGADTEDRNLSSRESERERVRDRDRDGDRETDIEKETNSKRH